MQDKGPRKLTERQQKFIEQFLLCGNAAEAARAAGYSKKTANREGSRLLSNVDIQAALKSGYARRRSEFEISEKRILQELAGIAFFNIRDLFENDPDGNLRIKKLDDIPVEVTAALESVSIDKSGIVKFKASPKVSAAQALGQFIGMSDGRPPDSSANRKAALDRLRNYLQRRVGNSGNGGGA
jgi:phage terminase small subunit